MAINDIFIPALPIDLAGNLDSASGAAGAALINAQWALTAALLRSALSANEFDSARKPATRYYSAPRNNASAPQWSKEN